MQTEMANAIINMKENLQRLASKVEKVDMGTQTDPYPVSQIIHQNEKILQELSGFKDSLQQFLSHCSKV